MEPPIREAVSDAARTRPVKNRHGRLDQFRSRLCAVQVNPGPGHRLNHGADRCGHPDLICVVGLAPGEQADELPRRHEPLIVQPQLNAGGNVIGEQSQRLAMSDEDVGEPGQELTSLVRGRGIVERRS